MKNYSKKSKKETPTFTVTAIRRTSSINVFSDEEKIKEPVIIEEEKKSGFIINGVDYGTQHEYQLSCLGSKYSK